MTHELLRVKQGGQVAERLKFDTMPIACALGGPARRTLFMLTSDSINPDECRAEEGVEDLDQGSGGSRRRMAVMERRTHASHIEMNGFESA